VLTDNYPLCIVQPVDGKALRRLRRACGLTQETLAQRLSVHWNTVARWERNEVPIRPAMEQLIRLVAKQGKQGRQTKTKRTERWG